MFTPADFLGPTAALVIVLSGYGLQRFDNSKREEKEEKRFDKLLASNEKKIETLAQTHEKTIDLIKNQFSSQLDAVSRSAKACDDRYAQLLGEVLKMKDNYHHATRIARGGTRIHCDTEPLETGFEP